MYDYGARQYMSDIGRWGVIDMLNSFTLDSYGYANNNPIFFNDPTGMIGECPTCPKEIDPNKLGGENNPHPIEEVVLTKAKPINVQKTEAYYANIIPYQFNNSGGLQFNYVPRPIEPAPFNPYAGCGHCYDGPVMMMSGDLFGIPDLIGIMMSNMQAKNRYAMMGVGLLAILATKGKALDDVVKAEGQAEMTTLYRSVSPAELKDIASNGLRTGGGYETSKLFTTTAKDASFFSKNMGWKWDGTANTIIKVEVPGSVMKQSTIFTADGIKSISIPSNLLQNVNSVSPLNYSPLIK